MADSKISALPASTTPLAGTEVLPIVQSGATKQVSVDNLTAGRTIAVAGVNATTNAAASAGTISSTNTTAYSPTAYNGAAARYTMVGGSALNATNGWRLSTGGSSEFFIGQVQNSSGYADFVFQGYNGSAYVEHVRVNSAGNIVIGTSGSGIDFSATPGTGTSELLADYEEGIFTPTVTCSVSGTITPASSADSLSYTKIGRVVYIYGNITIQSVSLPDGIILITLPFTVANLAEYQSQSGMPMSISGCALASTNSFVAIFEKNSATMKIFNGSTNSLSATAANQLQGGAELWFSASYVAA